MNVFRGNSTDVEKDLIFSTRVTYVRVDEEGRKIPLPK
jgi:hypothetical protein